MERKIGERFEHEGRILEVVDYAECAICAFYDNRGKCRKNPEIAGLCWGVSRTDKTSVAFQEVIDVYGNHEYKFEKKTGE